MKWLLAPLVLLLGVSVVRSQPPKRVITHDDVWTMRRLRAPVVSHDGKWVVVSVAERAEESDNCHEDLWLAPTDASAPPRRITASRAGESGVEWSPENQRVAFSSQRDGDSAAQIYVLDLVGGGDAERLTNLPNGARAPHWSPDGKQLLFTSDVGSDKAERSPPVDYDHALSGAAAATRRAHLFIIDLTSNPAPRDLFATANTIKNPAFSGVWSSTDEDLPAIWAPDGDQIVFVGTWANEKLGRFCAQLFAISTKGGEVERLTSDDKSYGLPVISPDHHKCVVLTRANEAAFDYSERHLVRFPWPFDAAKSIELTEKFDASPDQPVFSPDGKKVYFTSEQGGLGKIYSVPFDVGSVQVEFDSPNGVVSELASSGTGEPFRLIGVWTSAAMPEELFSFELKNDKWQATRLSEFNVQRSAGLDLFPAEHFWFQTSRGDRLHTLIVRPAGFDPTKKYPVLAAIHDGPHAMAADVFGEQMNYHLLAGSDRVVLATNYVGSTGFGEAFARGIQGNPDAALADIDDAVREIARRYAFVDATRVSAIGLGFGGRLVEQLELANPHYRALIARRGAVQLPSSGAEAWLESGYVDAGVRAHAPDFPLTLSAASAADAANTSAEWNTPILLGGPRDAELSNFWRDVRLHTAPARWLVLATSTTTRHDDARIWSAEVSAWLRRYEVNDQ